MKMTQQQAQHFVKCPKCKVPTFSANTGDGLLDVYCEECGWPESEFNAPTKSAYHPKPRGMTTTEWIGCSHYFPANAIPRQPNFNRRLAETITRQVVNGYFDLDEIKQVAPNARHPLFNDVPCDYGVRMGSQFAKAILTLKKDPDSRRAVCILARPDDEKPPCIQLIQFFIRDNKIITVAYMRSWDLLLGYAYDIHLFQTLGSEMSKELNKQQGCVWVLVGSSHKYEN